MRKKILFLMSDTGGGHRAAARAITEAIDYLYPDRYETLVEDIWKAYIPWPINKIPNTYPWLTGPGLPLWKLMWLSSTRFKAHRAVLPGVSPMLKRDVIRYYQTVKPDLVVSVHPLMNYLTLRWLRRAGLQVPFVTVVTDLITIHPLWINPDVDLCIVPTEVAKNLALRFGMPPEKLVVCGQPISLKFGQVTEDKLALRRKLGLNIEQPAVLVMGGGEGMGRVYEITQAIAQARPEAQLLVVSGRNQALKARLESRTWEIPVHIYGFVDNMPELMRAADLLITKAGPGTICEAFTAGLPLILFGYIPGQEQGNVAYVQTHQAGTYIETPQKIAETVCRWLAPGDDTLQRMARNAVKLAQPEASLKIAARICGLI